MKDFITALPKTELHVHLLGTLTPAQIGFFALKNNSKPPYSSTQEALLAYRSFSNLKQFLQTYACATQVIRTEHDFYDLFYAYALQLAAQGVLHFEIFFEAQSSDGQNINFQTIISGLRAAKIAIKEQLNITCELILCFLRDRSVDEAFTILEQAIEHKDIITAIGLASNERNFPPSHFIELYQQAKAHGFKLCVHAGEDAGPEYIWQTIELLKADRIDHGITCMQDPILVDYLVKHQIPLTVCPLSNIKLGLYKTLKEHPLKTMLAIGLNVSINSDDPAFFGSLLDNFKAAQNSIGLSRSELITCAGNSFEASFVGTATKQRYIAKLNKYIEQNS